MAASRPCPDAAPGGPRAEGRHRARVLAVLLLAAAVVILLVTALWVRFGPRRPPPAPVVPVLPVGRFATPEFPLDRGLALVVFLSTDCAHCLEAAQCIGKGGLEAEGLGVYFILWGKPEEVGPFLDRVGATVPYTLTTAADYAEFAGQDPPGIYLLREGTVLAQWSGTAFNLNVLRAELTRPR